MSDQELLKMAGKASGLRIRFSDSGDAYVMGGMNTRSWNPLANDGDALRLLVELQLELTVFRDHVTVFHATSWCDELHGDDPFAATRRAIVRAAAEVGRA